MFSLKTNPWLPLTISLLLLISGCASQSERSGTGFNSGARGAPQRIAILAVTVAPGVKSGQGQSLMATSLKELIHKTGSYRTLKASDVEIAMNAIQPESYRSVVDYYAKNGVLGPNQLSLLRSIGLPVETALIIRVERNQLTKQFDLEPMRDRNGVILRDRERKILITGREVQMRASLINMASGSMIWSRSYRSAPETKRAYVRYSGSSFSGTLAASLVNTMTTGLREPDWPMPVSYQSTVQSLMREIVRNMPTR